MNIGGYVYILRGERGAYKIGRTKDPENRLKTFSVKLSFEVEYVHVIPCEDERLVEAYFHEVCNPIRINGEWFALEERHVRALKSIKQMSNLDLKSFRERWTARKNHETRFSDNPEIENTLNDLVEIVAATTVAFLKSRSVVVIGK